MKYLLVLVLLLLGCQPGFHERTESPRYEKSKAKTLSPQARLRKLSLHIRGIPPTIEEFENLRAAMERGQVNHYFKEKISSYLKSPQHLGKMMDRLDELFGIRVPIYYLSEKHFWELPVKAIPSSIDFNSMDLIFQKVIKENRDWNYLFTAKEYKLLNPPNTSSGRVSDLAFYSIIRPDLPEKQNPDMERVFLPLVFDSYDARIAGSFTTSRFTARYNTTLLNKNRRRAAAVFRILLCDDMKPLIPTDEDISDIAIKSFPKTSTSSSTSFPSDEFKHGSQQSCFACHQKLDPMGEVFRMTGNVLGAEKSPGALVYPSLKGDLINIHVQGIGEATQAATEQIEYKYCQTRRFWDWFIGKDVPLNETRLRELALEFDRLNRKPNDFAAFLVQQPEFQIDQSGTFSSEVNFSQVKPILKQCSLCHSGVTTKNIPSFEAPPFGGTKETHRQWLDKIITALDFKGNGAKASMPPKNSGWILSSEESQTLFDWISAGAQDENGNRTSDETNVSSFNDEKKTGVFGYASLRYLASSDTSRLFSQKFPNGWNDGLICTARMDEKATGYFNTVTQEPFLKGPSLSFVKWFVKCLLDVSTAEFKVIKAKSLTFDKFLGSSVLKKTKDTPLEDLRKNADKVLWANIPLEIQSSIVTHIIEDAIGRQVAGRQNEIFEKALRTIATMQNPVTTEVIQKVLLVVMLQDEFLTY